MVVQKWIWQGVAGTAALYFALSTHYLLGLWAFYERRHFGWTRPEVVQVVLGLTIPLLLMNHLFVTRISLAVYGTEKGYAQELYSFWVAAPRLGVLQVSVLIVAWIHGCIGMYQWLRLKPMFSRWMPYLFCGAVPAAGARADGLLSGRTDNAQSGSGPRLARGQSEPVAGRHASGRSPAHCLARLEHRRRDRPAGAGSSGQAGAGLARTARSSDPRHLFAGTIGQGSARLQRTGCKPKRRHPSCQYLRRPGPLLHLPHPRHRRRGQNTGAVRRGARGTGTGCRRPVGSAGLPGPASRRCLRGAAAAG